MSRFTTSILLATALLGVLLWVVVSMAVDFARAPEEPLTPPEEIVEYDPALPRISTRAELISWLDGRGYAGDALVRDFDNWLSERGFPEGTLGYRFARDEMLESAPDADLLIIAGIGEISALQELAERSLREGKLLEALEWYEQAIVNGSLYAMLRKADLIDTASDPALAELAIGNEGDTDVRLPRADGVRQALAWSLATVTVGGYPVMSEGQAERINRLLEQTDPLTVDLACEAAQELVLETATARRTRGGAVFSTERPALAVAVADAETLLPCSVPIVPLVSMEGCISFDFVEPADYILMRGWICTSE